MAKKVTTTADLEAMGLVEISSGVYKNGNKTFSAGIRDRKQLILTPTFKVATTESILVIDGIVAGLNGSKGLMRGHWSNIKKQKDLYQMIIAQHLKDGKVKKHSGEVTVQYIGYKSSFMDWDNFCASFKHIGDSLQKCGIVTNDSPKIIRQFIPNQIKCKRADQKVVVIIKDI